MAHRILKTLHGWLGLLVWPWLLILALTGLYQNHQSLIDPLLPNAPLTADLLARQKPNPITAPPFSPAEAILVHGRPGWQTPDGTTGIDAQTATRWTKTPYLTRWTTPEGQLIAWRIDWQSLFLCLHRAGWASDRLGTWPADLAALALLLFAASGLWLFLTPRLRRLWRRWLSY